MTSILTSREKEVFELLITNKTTKEIAEELFISEKTVRNHISNVMQKLQVKGRAHAVVELIRLGELNIFIRRLYRELESKIFSSFYINDTV